jgi:hypothetical protein
MNLLLTLLQRRRGKPRLYKRKMEIPKQILLGVKSEPGPLAPLCFSINDVDEGRPARRYPFSRLFHPISIW